MKKYIAGIDEAGRGPCLGPLVIGIVLISESKVDKLNNLNLKDSKLLTDKQRRVFYNKIVELSDFYSTAVIQPDDIDHECLTTVCLSNIYSLVSKVIKKYSKISELYVDAVGKFSYTNFCNYLSIKLHNIRDVLPTIVYEPKADQTYPIVSAAAIVAKVTRDNRIKDLHKKVGYNFGSGYPNKKTDKFIADYLRETKTLPPGVRTKWRNVKNIIKKPPQLELL